MINPISSFFQRRFTRGKVKLSLASDAFAPNLSLRDLVIKFFQREEWQFSVTKNPDILRVACEGESLQWYCYAQIDEAEQRFAFYSVCPYQASPGKLAKMAEYTSRANYGMTIGNFELDFADGEIRYKTSMDFQDNQPTIGSISQLVYTNILMMERYLPGILAIVKQDVAAERAIEAIEVRA